jgi:hypothetical protein
LCDFAKLSKSELTAKCYHPHLVQNGRFKCISKKGVEMRSFLLLGATLATLGSGPSEAAGVHGWSVVTGRTVGASDTVLHLQIGWPGVSATLLHGVTPKVDLGAIFTFNYGFEGDVTETRPGLKFQGLLRANFFDSHRFNLGIHLAPGALFYFYPATTVAGIAIPVGLAFGIRASSLLNVGLTFDLPMFVLFSSRVRNGQLVVPALFGAGLEYFLGHNVAFTLKMGMGPIIYAGDGVANFDLQALIGFAFRL